MREWGEESGSERAEKLRDQMRVLLGRVIIRTLDALQLHWVLAKLLSRFIRPLNVPRGASTPLSDHVTTCLVLDAFRFRGDLETLARHSDLRFLTVNWELLRLLLRAFTPPPVPLDPSAAWYEAPRLKFFAASEGSALSVGRGRYRAFLRKLLPRMFEQNGIDVVISSDLRFTRLADFSCVASRLGYPFICLYREAMFQAPAIFERGAQRHTRLGSFRGDVIVVHNSVTKEMLLASGICDEKQVTVLGCPRADELLQLAADLPQPTSKQIALFSAPFSVPYRDPRGFDLTDAVLTSVRVVARFAIRNADVRVVIKMKDLHLKNGDREVYEKVICETAGCLPANIEFVTQPTAAHAVIMESAVVVAMQSTVVLEAAIAGKPVILPHFHWLLQRAGARRHLMFLDYHDLFDVPDTEAELENMLGRRLRERTISDEIMMARRDLFTRFVSPVDGFAATRCVELIRTLGEAGKRRRFASKRRMSQRRAYPGPTGRLALGHPVEGPPDERFARRK